MSVDLAAILAAHYPHLFRCSCGADIRTRPLPDQGEREAAWAEHVASVLPPGSGRTEEPTP